MIGADYIHDSSLYGSFMDAVAAHGLEVQHPAVGAEYTFGSGEFTILSPKETVSFLPGMQILTVRQIW